MEASRAELIHSLASRIQAIEAGERLNGRPPLSLGIPPVEQLFPEPGLPAGSLVELFSEEAGVGACSLALGMARQATAASKRAVVIVDGRRSFYPPAAARLGLDLDRIVIVRPKERQLVSVLNQALRCPAVGAVLSACAALPTRAARQLQLAAEIGGGVGLLLRPDAELRSPSFARLRLRITSLPSPPWGRGVGGEGVLRGARGPHPLTLTLLPQGGEGLTKSRRLQVEVLRCRGGSEGQCWTLEIDDDTHLVHVLPEVAAAAAVVRSARASG